MITYLYLALIIGLAMGVLVIGMETDKAKLAHSPTHSCPAAVVSATPCRA